MKEKYIEIMEKALSAYTDEHIVSYFNRVKTEGLTEHGFARLTANIGILIAHGRREDLRSLFVEMMDFCCKNMPISKAANDFTIREIIFCLMCLEEYKTFEIEKIVWWKSHFIEIDRDKCYTRFIKNADEDIRNWAFFTLVSEWMRKCNGLCDTEEFVEFQLIAQMRRFDENGQYHDYEKNESPYQPVIYDLVPRTLSAILLHFGYRGRYYEELRALMKKVTPLTLAFQSVNGELAFGGRSNQFIHNEAMLSTFLEFAANIFYEDGDIETAKKCKAAIKIAAENMELWLAKQPIRHVKNRFPTETNFGCEDYAYFDKYMITVASNIYCAYLICDESIPCGEQDLSPLSFETSAYFHKLVLRAGGYYLEFDVNADPHYDCSGLGRVHKIDAPSALCLSVPCTAHPNYVIHVDDPADISLCPGVFKDGEWSFATDLKHEIKAHGTGDASAFAQISCAFDGADITANYSVTENGVNIDVSGECDVAMMLPAFSFDGESKPEIRTNGNVLEVSYDGYVCRYITNGSIIDLGRDGGNRNGIYHAYAAKADKALNVKIEIVKE